MVLQVAPLFDLGVDFDVFYAKYGFLGQISHFGVALLIKSVTMLLVLCFFMTILIPLMYVFEKIITNCFSLRLILYSITRF
jgi:hypothetical protein